MILVTTSRKPGRKTRTFSRDLARAIPGSIYVNRGKGSVRDIVELARAEGMIRILIVGETKGNPSIIRGVEVLDTPKWTVQMYISPVKLCRDVGCTKNEGEGIRIESETYWDPLNTLFSIPIEPVDPVVVKEERGIVSFIYEGENVGPVMRVKGWDPIPTILKKQSGLK